MTDTGLTLARETTPFDQIKTERRNRGYTEVELRALTDAWGRARWPDARVCHELVIDRGSFRLDVAFVSPQHLAIVEIKSGYDTMDRAIHQCAMARAAGCEAWLITDRRHDKDVRLVKFLLPSIGIAEAVDRGTIPRSLEVLAEPDLSVGPHPEVMCSLLWVSELCAALRMSGKKPATHRQLVARLAALDEATRIRLVCQQLRGRDALWRADPPIRSDQV